MDKRTYEVYTSKAPAGPNERYLFFVDQRSRAEAITAIGYRAVLIADNSPEFFSVNEYREHLETGIISAAYKYVLCCRKRANEILERAFSDAGITAISGWRIFATADNAPDLGEAGQESELESRILKFIATREQPKEAGPDNAAYWKTPKPDNTSNYIDTLMAAEIDRFKQDKKTGFRNLDAEAGGLYSGLYVLAAISSLGKTSFALQLADQLAENGNDILYFSLEQSRLEMVSKSLARRTAQADFATAVTSLAIRKGYLPQQVLQAADDYKKAASDRISIIEGNFNCDIGYIGNYIREYIDRNGTRPTVFIDYLQILQPAEDQKRQTTKETIDTAVTQLKRISRELDITLIVISSVNRANYLTPIDFESLKESGNIEFTADVIWGLQLQCLEEPLFNTKEKLTEKRARINTAKAESPRKIVLSCLKNRYGIPNYSCYFNYYPANDLFTEDSTGTQMAEKWKAAATI